MRFFYLAIFLLLLGIQPGLNGQTQADTRASKIEQVLANKGFTDVKAVVYNGTYIIDLNTDQYRFAPDGISEAMEIIGPLLNEADSVIIQVSRLNMRLTGLHFKAGTIQNFLSQKINRDELIDSIHCTTKVQQRPFFRPSQVKNPSMGRITLHLEPNFGFQLGAYDIPFRYRFNIFPSLQIHLWKGAYFAPTFNLPVLKHYYTDKYNYIRPQNLSFHQFFRLPLNSIGRIGIGLFTWHRYGYDFEVGKLFFNGRLFFRANASYTGNAYYLKPGISGLYNNSYENTTWEITPIDYWNYFINFEYRYSKYDLAINAGYGRYLYHARAWNINIYRNFREYYLGFNAYLSTNINNFGFTLKIPLHPKKYSINTKFTVKPSKFIKYSYLATRDYVQKFEPGIDLEELIIELNPVYLQNYIMQSLFKKGNNN